MIERLDDGRVRIEAPLTGDEVRELHAGDVVLVSGTVYSARDAAHRRMHELLEAGEELPFDPAGQIVYYVGPTPARPGNVTGSAGPTTASRLDRFTPMLLERGAKVLIGKGGRGPALRPLFREHVAAYCAALGGGGALNARHIRAIEVIAFEDLGTEAMRRVELEDFPAWVINDSEGRDFYEESQAPWRRDDLLPEGLRRE